MFRSYATVIALTLATTATALAETAATKVADGVFSSRDVNADGQISQGEAARFASLAFASMDADDDDGVTLGEFQEWDLGFGYLATINDREGRYSSTKEAIFQLADNDTDARISLAELTAHVLNDFAISDADSDGRLTLSEASTRSPWVTALARAARR